jgi:PKD repeat protein
MNRVPSISALFPFLVLLASLLTWSDPVRAAAPVLNPIPNIVISEGCVWDQAISGSDADGDPLTFSKAAGPTYMTVTTTSATTGNIELTPGFADGGISPATVTASDGTLSDSKSFTIQVTDADRAPVLNQPANMSVAEGSTADQTITGSDPDVCDRALTFSKSAGPTFMTVLTTGPTSGNIHLAPGASTAGTYSATVNVSDGILSNSKSFTITIFAPQFPPTLTQPANMTVVAGATGDQVLNANDANGDPLSFSKAAGPTFMSVTTTSPGSGTATGNVHLAPGFSDTGTFSATVGVTDGFFAPVTKSFTITVPACDTAPVLAQPANMTVPPGFTADQVLHATDACGSALTFQAVSGPSFMTVTTTTPGTGTATGNIHLAPTFADFGTFTATIRATNGTFSSDKSFSITVQGPNNPPTLAQPANMTVNEGATADQTLNATDLDGNPLSFTLVSGPTYATVSTTSAGTGTATGNIHLAPGFADSGVASATIRASDGTLNNDKSLTVTVNNVNRPPILAQPANMTASTCGGTADQAITARDPDGDPITFSKVSGPTFMTVTTTSAGTGTATGNVHLAPAITDGGTYLASVAATANGESDTKSFTITILIGDPPPVLNQPSNMTVDEGGTADQAIMATQTCGGTLTLSLASGPPFVTVTTNSPGAGTVTGNIHLAPTFSDAGTYSVVIRVSDGNITDTKSLTVTVNDMNRPPMLTQPANMTVTEGATADQILTGTDPDGDPLTFSRFAGPIFMTVFDVTASTGDLHLAPGFADAGIYRASVRASDGLLSDVKSLTITVNEGANRCPVANPGGPYSGLADVPIAFDGSASFDPDGNPLFYAWDFDASNGVGADAVGVTATHAYASGGSFVVTLQVSDLGCTVSATTTASVVASCPATVFNGYDVIRLGSGKPTWFAFVQPASGCYVNTDVILSSFVLKYAGKQIPAEITKNTIDVDKSGDGISEIRVTFSKESLRGLFAGTGLGNGHNLVTVTIEANLVTGGILQGTTEVDAFNNGSFSAPTVAPNPLNPTATLTFTTSRAGFVKVELYDVGGRLVRTILDEPMLASGVHEVRIDGRGARGGTLASGIYFIRGVSEEGAFTKTIAILK